MSTMLCAHQAQTATSSRLECTPAQQLPCLPPWRAVLAHLVHRGRPAKDHTLTVQASPALTTLGTTKLMTGMRGRNLATAAAVCPESVTTRSNRAPHDVARLTAAAAVTCSGETRPSECPIFARVAQ